MYRLTLSPEGPTIILATDHQNISTRKWSLNAYKTKQTKMFFTPNEKARSAKEKKKNDALYVNMLAEINKNLEQVYGILESPRLKKLRQHAVDDATMLQHVADDEIPTLENQNNDDEAIGVSNNRLIHIENLLLSYTKSIANRENSNAKKVDNILENQKKFHDVTMIKLSSLSLPKSDNSNNVPMVLNSTQELQNSIETIEYKISSMCKRAEEVYQDTLNRQEGLHKLIFNMSKNNQLNQSQPSNVESNDNYEYKNMIMNKLEWVEESISSTKQLTEKMQLSHEQIMKKQDDFFTLHIKENTNHNQSSSSSNNNSTLSINAKRNNDEYRSKLNSLENILLRTSNMMQNMQKKQDTIANTQKLFSESIHTSVKQTIAHTRKILHGEELKKSLSNNVSNNVSNNKIINSELTNHFNRIEKLILSFQEKRPKILHKTSDRTKIISNDNTQKLVAELYKRFDLFEKMIRPSVLTGISSTKQEIHQTTNANGNDSKDCTCKCICRTEDISSSEDIRNIIQENFKQIEKMILRLENVEDQNSRKFNWFLFIQTIFFIAYFSSFWLHNLQVGIHDYSRSL